MTAARHFGIDAIICLHSSLSTLISLHAKIIFLFRAAKFEKVDESEISNLAALKRKIILAWREIDADKELCKRMMASIPKRLEAVIKKNGAQITKEDY